MPPLTPDFDSYAASHRIEHVATRPDRLTIVWTDGRTDHFNRFWLRENAVAPGVVDPETREREFDVCDWPEDLAIKQVQLGEPPSLLVTWAPDGAETQFHTGWLRAMGEGAWRPQAGLPARKTWDAAAMPSPPTFAANDVLSSDDALQAWLCAIATFGFARLRGGPAAFGFVRRIAEKIGTIRPTNFGELFIVESKPDPDSTAYTGKPLAPHSDLPTRETQPGLQLLHCIENTCSGGASLMVDGFRLAEDLRTHDPDAFASLSEISWVHTNRHRDTDYRWSGPIIEVGPSGAIGEVRMANFLRVMPDCGPEDFEEAYRAVRLFMRMSLAPDFTCRSQFEPGDLVLFENRRILHGRDAFDPVAGSRCLEGCYLDRDELYSRLRVLDRRRRTTLNA